MPKTKKILITSVALIATLAPIATMVSCGSKAAAVTFANKYSWKGDKSDLYYKYPTTDGQNTYVGKDYQLISETSAWDSSTVMHEFLNGPQVGPVKKVVTGYEKIDKNGNKINDDIKEEKIVLEAAEAVEVKYTESGTAKIELLDNENINDFKTLFLDKMSGATPTVSIQEINIVFPEAGQGAKWVKYGTGEKIQKHAGGDYEVNAEDYWYTIQHSIYSYPKNRERDITTEVAKVINPIASEASFGASFPVAASSDASSPFTNGGDTLYGLNLEPFITDNKADFIKDGKASFTFNEDATMVQIRKFWDVFFANKGGYKLKSAQQIEEAKAYVDRASTTKTSALKAALEPIKNSKTYKYGVYQLQTQDWTKIHSAGQYYISQFDSKYTKMNKNRHYVDLDWVNSNTNVNSLTFEFVNGATYQSTSIDEYKQGSTYAAPLNVESHRTEAEKEPEKYGVVYTKGYTANAMVNTYAGLLANPIGTSDFEINNSFRYYFSDDAARAFWGGSIEDLTVENPTPEQIEIRQNSYKRFFAGEGFQLRSAMRAFQNEYHSTKAFRSTLQEWGPRFAPELAITSTVSGQTKTDFISYKTTDTTIGEHNPITTKNYYSVAANGTISRAGEITRKEYQTASLTSTNSAEAFAITGDDRTKIVELMSDALTSSGLTTTSNVLFELPMGSYLTSKDVNINAYQPTKNVFNNAITSNPKLTIVPSVNYQFATGADATVRETDFTETWTVPGNSTTDKDGWKYRVHAAGVGTGVFGLKPGGAYAIASPAAPLLQNIGYLQDGMLFALSHAFAGGYDSIPELAAIKPVAGYLNTAIEASKPKWATQGATTLKSSIKTAALADLAALNFADFINSDITETAKFDYVGFKGFEDTRAAIRAAKALAEAEGATEEQKVAYNLVLDDYHVIQDFLNAAFQDAMYIAENELPKLTIDAQMKIYDAFDELAPHQFNIQGTSLGNRTAPGPSLRKSFVDINNDEFKVSLVSNWRINR